MGAMAIRCPSEGTVGARNGQGVARGILCGEKGAAELAGEDRRKEAGT